MTTDNQLIKKLWATSRGYTGCFKEFQVGTNKKIYLFEIYYNKYKVEEYALNYSLDTKTIFKELDKAIELIKSKEFLKQINDFVNSLKEG